MAWTIAFENAGMSSGLRLVMMLPSVTTSRSTQLAPALMRSVWTEGQEVMVWPLTTPASMRVHGAWQMAATGLPVLANSRTKLTADLSIAEFVRVHYAARENESVVVGGIRVGDQAVDLDCGAPVRLVPALDLALLDGEDFDLGAGSFEVLLWFDQLGLLESVGCEDGNCLAFQLIVFMNCSWLVAGSCQVCARDSGLLHS